MNEKEKIPRKNYIIFITMMVSVSLIAILSFTIFENYKYRERRITPLKGIVEELELVDLDNYIENNNELFLLFGNPLDDFNSRELEQDLVRGIRRRKTKVIYVSVMDLKDKKSFIETFNNNYSEDKKLHEFPAFLYIKDKKIIDLVERTHVKLYYDDVLRLLDKYRNRGDKND